MLSINGKQFRNLTEQVAYLTECYAQGVIINADEQVAAVGNLPPATSVMEGYTVAVGAAAPYDYYLSSNGSWVNLGTFPAKGDTGARGMDGYCLFTTSQAGIGSGTSELNANLFYNPADLEPKPGDVVVGGSDMNIYVVTGYTDPDVYVEWRGMFKGDQGIQGPRGYSVYTTTQTGLSAGTTSLTLSYVVLPAGAAVQVGDLIIGGDAFWIYVVNSLSSTTATVSQIGHLNGAYDLNIGNGTGANSIVQKGVGATATGARSIALGTNSTASNADTLVVMQDTYINNDLTVQGHCSLQDHVSVNGTLNAIAVNATSGINSDGTMSCDGSLTVGGTTSLEGNVLIEGNVQIVDAGDLSVAGDVSVSGNTDIDGNLTVTGTFPEPASYVKNVSRSNSITTFTKEDDSTVVLNVANGAGTSSLRVCNSGSVSGGNSIAIGAQSTASGNYCLAQGYGCKANTSYCFASGNHSESGATGVSGSIAIGTYVNSKTETNKIAMGRYNVDMSGNALEIGNGADADNRSNALELTKTGGLRVAPNVRDENISTPHYFKGDMEINGYTTLDHDLQFETSTLKIQIGGHYLGLVKLNIGGTDYWLMAEAD
jgi:hypothetical protein